MPFADKNPETRAVQNEFVKVRRHLGNRIKRHVRLTLPQSFKDTGIERHDAAGRVGRRLKKAADGMIEQGRNAVVNGNDPHAPRNGSQVKFILVKEPPRLLHEFAHGKGELAHAGGRKHLHAGAHEEFVAEDLSCVRKTARGGTHAEVMNQRALRETLRFIKRQNELQILVSKIGNRRGGGFRHDSRTRGRSAAASAVRGFAARMWVNGNAFIVAIRRPSFRYAVRTPRPLRKGASKKLSS